MMRRMFASSFGCFSSLLGLRRLDKSLTQTMPARNSLSPSSTVERPQPNTSSAVRALPSNNASVTSAIACRRSGHATRFTRRPANSTAHSGICLFSNRDFFMCLALFLVAHENTYKWYVSNYVIPYASGVPPLLLSSEAHHHHGRERPPRPHVLPGLEQLRLQQLRSRMSDAEDLSQWPHRRDLRQDRPGNRRYDLFHSHSPHRQGPSCAGWLRVYS